MMPVTVFDTSRKRPSRDREYTSRSCYPQPVTPLGSNRLAMRTFRVESKEDGGLTVRPCECQPTSAVAPCPYRNCLDCISYRQYAVRCRIRPPGENTLANKDSLQKGETDETRDNVGFHDVSVF